MSLHGYTATGAPVDYVHPSASYQYPQPSHTSFYDPNAFRQFYTAQLTALTFNSRHIIQNLSMIAQEYIRMSDIVVQCIEMHIRRVQSGIKLPAWYLLDALCKNVPIPYARLFAPLVSDLFLDSYNQVDPNTRVKMEEMLWTWRDGGQTGRELFGIGPQESIERAISQTRRIPQPTRTPVAGSSQESNSVTKGQVLIDLELTLNQQERRLQLNQYDNSVRQNIDVLKQLRNVVQTTHIKPDELVAIDSQLRQMNRELPLQQSLTPSGYASNVPISQSTYEAGSSSTYPPIDTASLQSGNSIDFSLFTQAPPSSTTNRLASASAMSGGVHLPLILNNTSNQLSQPSGVTNTSTSIAKLYNSLIQAGLVPASTTSVSNDAEVETKGVRSNEEMEYEHNLLSMTISLTTPDIAKSRSDIIPYLYERMPVQCKQCAIRFPDSSTGKKSMEDHLDMHFRQNRKASETVGRGHSRSWFIGLKDWINDGRTDVKGKGRADAQLSEKGEVAETKLRASYVLVPPGDEAKSIQCPICKETLKCEFLEEDEDWAWKNAIRVQGRIYHATCHAETATATSLASRLRHEAAAERSRSGTPELNGAQSTAIGVLPIVNHHVKRSPTPDIRPRTKRKIEQTDDIKSEPNEIPPLKKHATSSSK